MSSSVYDTAWVSMILKGAPNSQQCLFPDAFQYILDKQSSKGGWPSYADPVDGILNTAAALLSMLKHLKIQGASAFNFNDQGKGESLTERIEKGSAWLQSSLDNWDVKSCNHVGFEVLVPAPLGLISDYNITFYFPGAQTLRQLNATKLANFNEQMLYTKLPTSLLHSLEAFVGQIDFERVQHHLINGSLMGSPAATAAYLMNVSNWDTQAEEYLRRACA
ncbi:geranylgeranyl pyrophosphate synthetase [Varicellaria rhodocarpa]|nr:geranylgeranyl pyrophosphate synthetase [Varicellaria rhodocarpa]